MPHKVARYGWLPDLPDQRDHMYAAPPGVLSALPPSFDLTSKCPPVYDQGQIGSCTANAIAAALEFDRLKQGLSDFVASRLFIYYNERAMEGTVSSDSGAMIRDGIKSVATLGDCPENLWPYDGSPFPPNPKLTQKPPRPCYDQALKYKAVQYQRLSQILNQLKGCLASGFPFVFGFTVYESFEGNAVAQSGHASLPSPGEAVVGGHAVMAVGYDDNHQWFIVRNSWGNGWGMKGYFTLPYAYVTDPHLANDFWTIRSVQ